MISSSRKRKRLSQPERKAVHEKCNGHCAYCGKEIPISKMQVDHVCPVELGGEDIFDNYLPSCRSCNNYKSSLTLSKFREAIERWPFVLERDNVTFRNAVRFGMVELKPHKVIFYYELLGIKVNEWPASWTNRI